MQAMYNMQNMRGQKMGMMGNSMGPGGPGGPMGFGPNGPNSNTVAQWVQQQNQNLQEQGLGMNEDPRMMYGPQNPNFSQMMMESGMFDPDMNIPGGLNNMNLMQSKVPNENLTPEQLQRREEQLANLRKIQQMLFPEQRQGQEFPPGSGGPGPGPGMMPGDMNMGMYQQMASKRAMMMAQQNMHGMMERQEIMSEQQFMMSQGMSQFGPGPHPQNMQNMSQAQREWMRLQQEYMMEKRQVQHRSMAQNGPGPQMGPGMEPSRGGQGQPPPSYYSSIAQKQRHGSVGMASPTSPNMNGPLGSPSMTAQGPDPIDPLMFPTGPQRKSSFSGMDPLGPMGPGGGPGMGMDPMMQHPQGSPMNPNGGPGMVMDPMLQHPQGSPMNPNMMGPMGMPHNRQNNAQVTLQRAGNPEQFHPDMASTGPINNSAKPPPSYAQSQSTKRKREDMEELCKNLQPTPSPQHISYLNQFEGQELTITKQVNTAYREPNSSESQSNQFSQNQVVNSPIHGPNSNKGPMSNSSQTSSGPLGSPVPVTANPGQGPSPMSGANMRLSHYDPQQQPPHNPSISNSPTGSSGKSSLSNNITSATLANLAKGVENLSNQMQQHMMQGGPFHSIQMQGQQQQQNQQNSQGPPSHSGAISSAVQSQNQTTNALTTNVSSQTQSTPSVNNTFVNATMSIQQVNIQQNVPPGQNSFNTNGSTMQVQQMNMEQTQLSMSQSGSSQAGSMNQTGNMTQSASMNQSNSMTQSVCMSQTTNKNSPAVPQNSKMPNTNMGSPASAGQHGNMGNMGGNKMSPFTQSQNPSSSMGMSPQVPGSGRPGSPNFASSSMGNVQVQQKAPNTIQYLPANQSGMPPEPKNMKPDLGFIQQQFDTPLLNVEGKVPTSKMQYFPSGQPYGPEGMVQDPRMGPGQDPRIGPGQELRMVPGQDPRLGPGQDPRMGPGQDMRMVPGQNLRMGPGQDPRMGPGQDPRMGPGQDPRLVPGQDPRMGPGQDPRMGPRQDPRMMQGQDPRMGPGMGQGPDPRMIGQGIGPGIDPRDPRMGSSMGDPRMGPGPDPRMGQRPDPRMGPGIPDLGPGSMGSMTDPRMGPSMGSSMGPGGPVMPGDPIGRPVSRGSPFTGPIGPAVQQSMMMRRGSLTDIPSITMGGIGSPDPMASMAGMSSSMRENPMSALSSMSGNPMNSVASSPMAAMSNMSNSIMSEQMGPGPMGPSGGMESMGNMPYNSPPYQGGGPGQSVMNNPMMSRPGGPMSMHGMGPRMQGPGSSMGGMSRQGMRIPGPGMGPGPLSPGAPGYSSAQYQQFQQQLYSQGRSRQMSPMDGMMGNPGPGYMGPGPGPGMNPGMMPGMHGPM